MQIYSISSLVVQHARIFICSVSNYFNIVLFFSSREQSTCSLRMYHVYVKLKLCDDISSNFRLWRKQFWERALLIFKKKYFMKLYFAKKMWECWSMFTFLERLNLIICKWSSISLKFSLQSQTKLGVFIGGWVVIRISIGCSFTIYIYK